MQTHGSQVLRLEELHSRTCCGSFGGGSAQPPPAQAHRAHSCYGQTRPNCRRTHCPSDVLKALSLQSLPQEEPAKVAARIVLPKPVEAGAYSQSKGCNGGFTPPFRCLLMVELCFCGGPRASLTNTSGCCSTTLQSLQLSPHSQQQSSP